VNGFRKAGIVSLNKDAYFEKDLLEEVIPWSENSIREFDEEVFDSSTNFATPSAEKYLFDHLIDRLSQPSISTSPPSMSTRLNNLMYIHSYS
jgi:hypothetical protein